MSEKKVYSKLDIIGKLADGGVAAVIGGRITSDGYSAKKVQTQKGETTVGTMKVSLSNRKPTVLTLCKMIGADESAAWTVESNGNEYTTLSVSLWGPVAERAAKVLKAGDIVEVPAAIKATKKEDKTYLQVNGANFDVKHPVNKAPSANTATEEEMKPVSDEELVDSFNSLDL